MKLDDERDRELDALLRQPLERLVPPEGSWEQVRRRARRRKFVKAAIAVSAVVLVIAGAVPAIIGVRHNSSNQRLVYANPSPGTSTTRSTPALKPSPSTSIAPLPAITAVPAALKGYRPESVSFISQQDGFLWGSVGSSPEGTVARTLDGGATWQVLASPKVETALGSATNGDSQIRFASPEVGFIFGPSSYVSTDGGFTWLPFVTPGHVEDIETVRQQVWALIREPGSQSVGLYATSVKATRFHRVTAVPAADTPSDATATNPGVNSIALSGRRVGVLIGGTEYYTSPDGKHFTAGTAPCPGQVHGQGLVTALVSSWGSAGVVAGCGYQAANGKQTKLVYTAPDGRSFQAITTAPAAAGYMQTLSASARADLLIGSVNGPAQASTDSGRSWSSLRPGGVTLSFAGYINPAHIVAIADDGPGAAEFTTSSDTGVSWTPTLFK
jgi:hypothetical protein